MAASASGSPRRRIRMSRPADGARSVTIWREAVDATHHFLAPSDRQSIDGIVQHFLPNSELWLAVDDDDRAMGFMLLEADHMAALFVAPAFHGAGVGRSLVEHALRLQPVIRTEVNEQNARMPGFYERLGFSAKEQTGMVWSRAPYPLIYLQLRRGQYRR